MRNHLRPLAGIAATVSRLAAAATAAALTVCAGVANATLVGDSVTVGHYVPSMGAPWIGGTPPATLVVQDGAADTQVMYNSFPFGYLVNVDAATIGVSFNYLQLVQGTWAASGETCSFVPPFGCTTVGFAFNGLGVADLDDSSGNALVDVAVDTNMVGWTASRLFFDADEVFFDWRGLSFDNDTYLNASLRFAGNGTLLPTPGMPALLLAGLGALGLVSRRQRR